MKLSFDDRFFYYPVTVFIMIVCAIIVAVFSGFYHESVKIKTISVHMFLVVLGQFLIGDTVKFILMSIDKTIWPRKHRDFRRERPPVMHTRTDFLKMRLNSLRAQLRYGQDHLNESLNLRFQLISVDLCLYGTYFLLLTCLVLVTRDELLYFNTAMMTKIFMTNRTYTVGLEMINELDKLYTFTEVTLINAFDTLTNETLYHSWIYGDQTSKLGVIRLRQLRRKEDFHQGWSDPEYSHLDYMPQWKLPYERMGYTDKYWNIYKPWLPSSVIYSHAEKFFLEFYKHQGYYHDYPETVGYITMLARTRNNSMKVINYLRSNDWVTHRTAALFLDFTLYNADANIFSICTLLVELTPFGTIAHKVEVHSIKMQVMDQLGTWGLALGMVYILVLIQFSKTLVVTLWYEPSKLRSMWNKLDLIILVLNALVVSLIIVQEMMVASLLNQIEYANKLQFVDFRKPALVKSTCSMLLGVLVMLTTLRLWKVLQFASVFQLFSFALFAAWQALASTALIIIIFLFGFSIAVVIINGNNTINFTFIMRSIANLLCFSFGFSQHISPQDLFHGGRIIGIILYLILAFVIAQLLINVFVSTINGYFGYAKAMRDIQEQPSINFLQFLRVEYYTCFSVLNKLPFFNRGYRGQNRTVAENIKLMLDEQEKVGLKNRHRVFASTPVADELMDESKKQANYRKRVARIFNVAAVMQIQMQLLE
ncbi:hypothetical protein KR093_009516, partial [Drosophila rubida]